MGHSPSPTSPPSLSRQDPQGASHIQRKLAFRHRPRAGQQLAFPLILTSRLFEPQFQASVRDRPGPGPCTGQIGMELNSVLIIRPY